MAVIVTRHMLESSSVIIYVFLSCPPNKYIENSVLFIKKTEIILAKVSRLCQLSSQSCGFLSKLYVFKSIRPSLSISLGMGRMFV
jgi:hypothetical protein